MHDSPGQGGAKLHVAGADSFAHGVADTAGSRRGAGMQWSGHHASANLGRSIMVSQLTSH